MENRLKKYDCPMSKELFIESINAITVQLAQDHKYLDAFYVILPNVDMKFLDNSLISKQMVEILKVFMNDRNYLIEPFLYDLGYRREYYEYSSLYNNGNPNESDAGKLWNRLMAENFFVS